MAHLTECCSLMEAGLIEADSGLQMSSQTCGDLFSPSREREREGEMKVGCLAEDLTSEKIGAGFLCASLGEEH